jgi:hypothetical protein
MAKRPKDPEAIAREIHALANALVGQVQGVVPLFPLLAGDWKAQAMAAVQLAVALRLADEKARTMQDIEELSDYLRTAGGEMLAGFLSDRPH